MADGGYCDFPSSMDPHQMSQLMNYGNRSGAGNFEGHHDKTSGMGFYTEQFQNISSEEMEAAMSMAMQSGVIPPSHAHGGLNSMEPTASSSADGMYEPALNYAMKPEKGLPPTPPGSPDDPKDGQGSSRSSLNQQLAKPVPMRRLSEKRIQQARASLTTASSSSSSSSSMETYSVEQNFIRGLPLGHNSNSSLSSGTSALGHHGILGSSLDPSSSSSGWSSAAALQASCNYQNSNYISPYMQFHGLAATASSPTLARALAAVSQTQKRPRSEKKTIPSEQKDEKYFERRKRNNHAAKKSRDARKAREDEIAIRASFLEKENAILRAQVATLREEANSLKQLLLQKRSRP